MCGWARGSYEGRTGAEEEEVDDKGKPDGSDDDDDDDGAGNICGTKG